MNTIFKPAGLLILVFASGCASTGGGPLGWFSSKNQEEKAIEQLVASQQEGDPVAQKSIYPPVVTPKTPLPKSESDLKNPTQLHLSYARLQEQLGNLTVARSSYEKVISKEPRSLEANIGLGRLEALAGHQVEAEQQFRKAIEVSPSSPDAFFAFGKFLASEKRYTEAIVEMQKAMQHKPDPKYKYEIGLTLARAGQYEQAFATISDLIGQDEAYYNIGYIAMKERNDPVAAQKYLKQALKVNPGLEQAQYWLAEIRMEQNRSQNHQQILPASAVQGRRNGHVRHALNVQPASCRNKESLIPTVVPTEAIPDGLTSEQLEQWKNQSGM